MFERIKRELDTTVSPALVGIVGDARTLLEQELSLLRHESKQEMSRIRRVALGAGIGLVLALITVGLLALTLVHGLMELFPDLSPWMAFGIVTLVAIAGLAFVGYDIKRRLAKSVLGGKLMSPEERAKAAAYAPDKEDDVEARILDGIDVTKSSLDRRLDLLTTGLKRTIDAAEETYTDVKVKAQHAVDPRYHVEQRPWAAFGMSFMAGLVLAKLLPDNGPSRPETYHRPEPSHSRPSSGLTALLAATATNALRDAVAGGVPSQFSSIARELFSSLIGEDDRPQFRSARPGRPGSWSQPAGRPVSTGRQVDGATGAAAGEPASSGSMQSAEELVDRYASRGGNFHH